MAQRTLKRLEGAWKTGWIRALARLLPHAGGAPLPDWDARPYRVLYLRYDRIGDMILATPLIHAIATSHPRITVDVLASPGNAVVLDGNPDVGTVVRFDRKHKGTYLRTFRALRRAHYDAVVDDHAATGTASLTRVLLMLATRAAHRIGVSGLENEFIYTHAVPAPPLGHQVEMASVVAGAFGVRRANARWRLRLHLTADERAWAAARWLEAERAAGVTGGRRLFINVSAADARRRWPDERFIETIRLLRERDPRLTVLVTGAPPDVPSTRAIAEAAGATFLEAGIRQAFALVASADLVLTPDTSITHVASAFEIPVAVLLSRVREIFTPWRVPHRVVWSESATLHEVPVAAVVAAVVSLLDEAPARTRTG